MIDEAVARLFAYREAYKPRRNTSDLSDGNAPSIAGADDEVGRCRVLTFRPYTGDLRWPGRSARPSIAAVNGSALREPRAGRLRAVCVRTAAGSVSRCHHVVPLYLGGPPTSHPEPASVWLCRSCHFRRPPIAAAHRDGTIYSPDSDGLAHRCIGKLERTERPTRSKPGPRRGRKGGTASGLARLVNVSDRDRFIVARLDAGGESYRAIALAFGVHVGTVQGARARLMRGVYIEANTDSGGS